MFDHEQAVAGLRRAVSLRRVGGVLQLDQVLEDPGREVRQRPEQLRRLHEVATGLDTAQGLSPSRPVRLRASGFFWRNPWAKAVLLLAPPLLAFALVYLASLVALFISAFWTLNPFTTEIEHIWNVDNFKT